MKIILAIFAIACIAAFLAIGPGDVPPAEEFGTLASLGDGALSATPISQPTMAAPSATAADNLNGGTADDLLRAAGKRLDGYQSVSALLRYRITMFDSELIGSGMYQQAGQGSERRYRLELKTQLGDKVVSLLHVCDGQTLWTYRERSPAPQLERLDLGRIRSAQTEAPGSPSAPVEELATGGLPKLIEGLRANFRPLHAATGYLDRTPMWALELLWKPSTLAALVPQQNEQQSAQSGDFSKLPQMPERIMVYLGHEDLFPRRIEFHQRASTGTADHGAGQGSPGEYVQALAVEFTDIRFNEPIDPRQFAYGAAGAVDVTEAFLRSRGLPIVK